MGSLKNKKVFRMPFELFIAKRYLKTRQRTGFINIITYISVIGVAIGVGALIIVISVMNGFEKEVRSRIVGFDTHIRLRTFHDQGIENYKKVIEKLRGIPHIIGMSPYIDEKAIIRFGRESDGVLVRGADPNTIDEVSDLRKNIVDGNLHLGVVNRMNETPLPGIIIGRYLADRMLIDVGDVVYLFSMKGMHSLFRAPDVKQFVVTAIFETGMYEYDDTYAYISIESAQKLFRLGAKVSGVEIKLDDLYKADHVVKDINERVGFPYYPVTWFEMRKTLFSWIQLEKWGMFIILCLIILVAAFNIISTLIMVVMEKTRDIGILKSMGATAKSVMRIFLFEGLFVGVFGTVIGLILGYVMCYVQQTYHIFTIPGEVYFINFVPVNMHVLDFIYIGSAGILICLISSIYPARWAAKLVPVDAIRYE